MEAYHSQAYKIFISLQNNNKFSYTRIQMACSQSYKFQRTEIFLEFEFQTDFNLTFLVTVIFVTVLMTFCQTESDSFHDYATSLRCAGVRYTQG